MPYVKVEADLSTYDIYKGEIIDTSVCQSFQGLW